MSDAGARTLIDRGGTFTDVVQIAADGQVHVRKIPSDQAIIGELTEGALTFGTIVATNALLERAGVETLLIVTSGFEDLIYIGDMTRPDLFDASRSHPAPLCERVVGITGRVTPNGAEVAPLELPQRIDLEDVQAVAVALVHAPPAHERAIERWLKCQRPDLYVALSHRIDPEVGYLARIHTTLVVSGRDPVLPRMSSVRGRTSIGGGA